MSKKNRLFHPQSKGRVIASQRVQLNKVTAEDIQGYTKQQLVDLIKQQQKVLDWYLDKQQESGFTVNQLTTYKKHRDNAIKKLQQGAEPRILKQIALNQRGALLNKALTVRGQKQELSNRLAFLRESIGIKKPSRADVSKVWEAYEKFKEASGLADKVAGVSSWTYIQNAIPEWQSIPANLRSVDALAGLAERAYKNASITAEDIMDDESIYESAIKNYRKFHPGFKGTLTTEQVILFTDDLV